jgi:2-dehydro-3-deoxygalactonokinase
MSNWIAVDWGTSNLRVWLVGNDGTILDNRSSDRGMGSLAPEDFEGVLVELVADWLGEGVTEAVACGMIGARQGWVEAPYAAVPCRPSQNQSIDAPCADPRLSVRILPGLSQTTPAPDVMRGEETQVAGFLAANPRFDGVVCLPGTHTKWVQVSAKEVVGFQTYMTGEMFALLSKQSVLRHSLGGKEWDQAAFIEALDDMLSHPAGLGTQLFKLRAAELLLGQASGIARAKLSGMLIGLELAGARSFWLGQNIALIGDAALCKNYAVALEHQGVPTRIVDATEMTLAGLTAAYLHNKDACHEP